ncbi:hypothetical protein ACFE04_008971 [Oxalis oulophora]
MKIKATLKRVLASCQLRKQDTSCITCTTFNILAPIYKRLDHSDDDDSSAAATSASHSRESDYRNDWLARNHSILDSLLQERSSIICLQEFWLGNEELVNMYEKRLGSAGLLIAVRKDYFRILNYKEFLFNDFGDRVAQLLHVELVASFCNDDTQREILIVNTHLLFPHDSTLSIVRLHQVYKILQYVESYQKDNELNPLPIILCGDWNGSKRGHVFKFLRSQGFVSFYDTAHQYTDADAHKWVSHRNHRGNICGVDFIWLLNPNKDRELLKTSWSEAVFGMFKYLLRKASLREEDAFSFLKTDNDGDFVTYSDFWGALRQLNLIGHRHGLTDEETKDLWVQADIDGNGILDYQEFQQQIWNPLSSEQRDEMGYEVKDDQVKSNPQQTIGFNVKNGILFPPEVEKGFWPENYSLSDHARLTVVFSPIQISCSERRTSPDPNLSLLCESANTT